MAAFALKVIGAVGLASYAAAYLCARTRHLSYFRFRVVAVRRASLPAMPRGYGWRLLGPDELKEHVIDVGPDVQAARFAEGLSCLGVFDRAGELAGVTWVAKRSHREPAYHVRCVLPPNAAWDTGLWVPEHKRMTRAFSAVWAALAEWLDCEGLEWSMSSILDYNLASITSHRRLGARQLRTVVVLRFGRVQITFGARPLLHIQASRRVPTMRLYAPTDAAVT